VIGVAWPSVRDEFRLTQSAVGLAFIGTGLGYFASSFTAGRLTSVWGVGLLLAVSSGLVAFANFGYAAAPLWAAFIASSVLHGLGSGAIDAGLNHYVAHHFSARHMNWLHACYALGATLGPIVMTTVITTSGWRPGYATIGTVLLLLSVLFFATRRSFEPDPDTPEAVSEAVSMLAALRVPMVWIQMILFFLYTGLEVTVGQWSFTILTESRFTDPKVAGVCVGTYWGSIGIGRVLFGFVVDRIGIDRLLRLCMGAAFLGTLLIAATWSSIMTIAGLILVGLALAPIFPCLMTRTPQRLGSALAAHSIGFQVGSAMVGAAVVPGFAGLLADSYGLEMVPRFEILVALMMGLLHELLIRSSLPAQLQAEMR
jgi:fucose permease